MTTYTLYTIDAGDIHVIARHLSARQAMDEIFAHDEKLSYDVMTDGYQNFCLFHLGVRRGLTGGRILCHATVPTSDFFEDDEAAALEILATQFLRVAHEYWDGRWDNDENFDEMLRYPADRADADRMETEILAKFVEALAENGYAMARDKLHNEFPLELPAGRAEFVQHLVEHHVYGALTVLGSGQTQRFDINLGIDGWNIVEDLTGGLGPVFENVIEPYRSKGHPAKDLAAGLDSIALRTPEDALAVFGQMSKNFG